LNQTLAITQDGTLVVILGAIAINEALKFQKLRELGPDEATNINTEDQSALADSDDTMNRINLWRQQNNLAPLTAPEPTTVPVATGTTASNELPPPAAAKS